MFGESNFEEKYHVLDFQDTEHLFEELKINQRMRVKPSSVLEGIIDKALKNMDRLYQAGINREKNPIVVPDCYSFYKLLVKLIADKLSAAMR
jgi:hypothetical protein